MSLASNQIEDFKKKLIEAQVDVKDSNNVIDYLSRPTTEILLPVLAPKELIPSGKNDRFTLYKGCIRFFGREIFKSLVQEYLGCTEDTSKGIEVFGNIGSGKSHLLCALVNYIQLMGAERHVVYVPSCRTLLNNDAHEYFLKCLKLSFPEDSLRDVDPNWDSIKVFVKKQPEYTVVFVFDDWNAFEGDENQQEKNNLRNQLMRLTGSQFRITALSAGAESAKTLQQSGTTRSSPKMALFEIFGGLTDKEWVEWQKKLLRIVPKTDQPLEPSALTDDQISKLSDLTGKNPLYLTYWKQFKDNANDTFEAVCNHFLDGHGRTIYDNLRNFTQNVEKDGNIADHVELMTAAIGSGMDYDSKNYSLIDQRYFFFVGCVLTPISKLVCHHMATILRKRAQDKFFNSLTAEWVASALNSSNPYVKGFAFEQYAIAKLAHNPSMIDDNIQNVQVIHFRDEKPNSLNVEGAVLYIPTRWNYPHIDCLLRSVKGEEKTPKKRTTEEEFVEPKLFLFPIQITLGDLTKHADFCREDNVKIWLGTNDPKKTFIRFIWVTNHDEAKVKVPQSKYLSIKQKVIKLDLH